MTDRKPYGWFVANRAQAEELLSQGLSTTAIARKMGVSYSTVFNHFKRWGLIDKRGSPSAGRPSLLQGRVEEFIALAPTMTCKQLAEYFGVTASTIYRYASEAGVTVRKNRNKYRVLTDAQVAEVRDKYLAGISLKDLQAEYRVSRETMAGAVFRRNRFATIDGGASLEAVRERSQRR